MKDDEATDLTQAVEIAGGVLGVVPGGSLLATLVNLVPQVQRTRAQAMLSNLIDLLGDAEVGLLHRIQSDDRVLKLVWDATNAAALSDTNAKLRGLSYVASRGLIDDAQLDEARYKIDILRELQAIDVRLLVNLEALPEESKASTADLLAVSTGVAHALNAKLVRLGLANTGGMTFGAVYSSVHITTFGREVLTILRDCGEGNALA